MNPISIKYTGTRLPEISGQIVTMPELAAQLDVMRNVLHAALTRRGAFEKGVATDDDLDLYLPPIEQVNRHKAALALSARAWG